MSDPTRYLAVIGIGAYNVVQNRLLPDAAYVPANLAVGAGMIALARRQGCSWEDLGFDPETVPVGLVWGAAGVVGASLIAYAGTRIAGLRPYLFDERTDAPGTAIHVYRTALRFPVGTALFEEVAFRGALYAIWRRSGASPAVAASVVAATFGAWHLIPTAKALEGNPLKEQVTGRRGRQGVAMAGAAATALASLGFGWLRRRSGSLIAPWLTHAAFNSAGYLAALTVRRAAGD